MALISVVCAALLARPSMYSGVVLTVLMAAIPARLLLRLLSGPGYGRVFAAGALLPSGIPFVIFCSACIFDFGYQTPVVHALECAAEGRVIVAFNWSLAIIVGTILVVCDWLARVGRRVEGSAGDD